MKKSVPNVLLLVLLLSLLGPAYGQAPVSNPYTNLYPAQTCHWTNSLPWGSVFDATTYGATPNDTTDDLAAIHAAIDAATQAGGGVVYLPAGTYKVSDHLYLKEGVIIRGANPTGITDAKTDGYAPPTKLEFPQYVPTFADSGTHNSTAFKEILLHNHYANHVGLVNLDINRAVVSFHPEFADQGGGNYQPTNEVEGCIIMGCRLNNGALPDPGIPRSYMHQWQRFTWRFTANIDVYFKANLVVCNNRINDSVTDTYDQPGYIMSSSGATVPHGKYAAMNYLNHLGISANRAKIITDNDGNKAIRGYIWYPYPWTEPTLWAKGVEINDNWVLTTMRVKIIASGLGLQIHNNVLRDSLNKLPLLLRPDGRGPQTNYSATYENRGIDASGWDTHITGNDVMAFHHKFLNSPYPTICGEGIMNQGNSGGTTINGFYLKNNTVQSNSTNNTNPAFTLYKPNGLHNVVFEGNQATGANKLIYLIAGNNPHVLNNVTVRQNINIDEILLKGALGGTQAHIENNTAAAGGGTVSWSCYATEQNNTNFAFDACEGPTDGNQLPFLTFNMNDTCFVAGGFNLPITATQHSGIAPDSVVFFLDGVQRLGQGTINGNTVSYNVPIPTAYETYFITACAYSTFNAEVRESWIEIKKVKICSSCAPTQIDEPLAHTNPQPKAWPNPMGSQLFIDLPSNYASTVWVQVFDAKGRIVASQHSTPTQANQVVLSAQAWPAGVYHLRIMAKDQPTYHSSLVKK